MKTYIKNLFLLPVLMAALSLIPASRVKAQTFTTLHPFSYDDGSYAPKSRLILSGTNLLGAAPSGGGRLFTLNTDGTGFTNLHSFAYASDGGDPNGLILSGNTLYGTGGSGPGSGNGTVFALNTDGTGFTNLHIFTGSSGGNLPSGLILSGNTLYGTTYHSGSSVSAGKGTVFAVNTDGSSLTILYNFTLYSGPLSTNRDGANPVAGLVLSGNTLYGTASLGGRSGRGTVFAVNTDGSGFTNLHSFTAAACDICTNSDGAKPLAGLILSGNILYGTASAGGSSGAGTVFALHTDGTGFTNLHSLTYASDGAEPWAELFLSGNTLYGTAIRGGSSGYGTVFALNTDGSGFTNLHNFTAPDQINGTNSDGINPYAGLILADNILYGATRSGGINLLGTVFSLSLGSVSVPPALTIFPSAANVILTWPTNAAGFTLQSALAVTGPYTNIPGANSPYTNSITGAQQFFRLSQ